MRPWSSRPTNRAQSRRIIASKGEATTTPQPELTAPRPAKDESYYVIWLPAPAFDLDEPTLAKAATVLELSAPELTQAVTLGQPVPLARANTIEQATTLRDELRAFGIESLTVARRRKSVRSNSQPSQSPALPAARRSRRPGTIFC
ncbi:MAG: hypothetical protein DMF71_02830 [Acidobacteria bacterium]|nr:MAG: hypothetical protein DMF71_02830 [Acidobacteriota bacterium]